MANKVRTFWRRTEDARNGIIVALLAVALLIILVQSFQAKTSASNAATSQHELAQVVARNHIKSVEQNATITKLLKEHSVDFAQQQADTKAAAAYDADVLAFAQTIQAELADLCVNHVPGCPPLPPIPGAS